jgi:hypothetical protein
MGLGGLAAAFNTIFSGRFALGKEGNSSNVLRGEVRRLLAADFGGGAEPGTVFDGHGALGRARGFRFIVLSRCVIEEEVDDSGLEAATASIRFQIPCAPVFECPFAEDLRAKILDRWAC